MDPAWVVDTLAATLTQLLAHDQFELRGHRAQDPWGCVWRVTHSGQNAAKAAATSRFASPKMVAVHVWLVRSGLCYLACQSKPLLRLWDQAFARLVRSRFAGPWNWQSPQRPLRFLVWAAVGLLDYFWAFFFPKLPVLFEICSRQRDSEIVRTLFQTVRACPKWSKSDIKLTKSRQWVLARWKSFQKRLPLKKYQFCYLQVICNPAVSNSWLWALFFNFLSPERLVSNNDSGTLGVLVGSKRQLSMSNLYSTLEVNPQLGWPCPTGPSPFKVFFVSSSHCPLASCVFGFRIMLNRVPSFAGCPWRMFAVKLQRGVFEHKCGEIVSASDAVFSMSTGKRMHLQKPIWNHGLAAIPKMFAVAVNQHKSKGNNYNSIRHLMQHLYCVCLVALLSPTVEKHFRRGIQSPQRWRQKLLVSPFSGFLVNQLFHHVALLSPLHRSMTTKKTFKKTNVCIYIYLYTYICMTLDQFDAYFFWLKQRLLPFLGGKQFKAKSFKNAFWHFVNYHLGVLCFHKAAKIEKLWPM